MKIKTTFRSLLTVLSFVVIFQNNSVAFEGQNLHSKINDEILALLTSQKFDQLEKMLDEIERDFESNSLKERQVDLAFDSFYRNNPKFEKLLSNWIKEKPTSYMAYTARGIYFTKAGWSKRGGKYIDETSLKQMDGMTYFFRKAFQDFEKARSL